MNIANLSNDLWLMRLYYLFFYGSNALLIPFLNLFYAELGLNGSQIGLMTALNAGITLLIAPVWTRKSEHSNHTRGLLQIALILSAVGCWILGYQQLFWGVVVVTIFRALVGAGILPLSDAVALAVSNITRAGYGSVRVWGSIGWIIVGLFGGLLIEHFGWSGLLWVSGFLYVFTALTLTPLSAGAFANNPDTTLTLRVPTRHLIQRLFQQPLMLGIAGMMIFTGVFNSGVLQFEGIFLAEMGATKSLISIISILGAIVEIPCMFWADKLIRRKGTYPILLMGMLLYVGIRASVLIFPSIPTIMLARASGGIAFSFFTIGQISFFGQYVKHEERRTIMALYNVTLVGIIGIIAPPMTGVVYDLVGARWLYGVAAVGYGLAAVSLWYARQRHNQLEPQLI